MTDCRWCNSVNISASVKLWYLCLAEIPGNKLWQHGEYQQLHFAILAEQHRVSPSE